MELVTFVPKVGLTNSAGVKFRINATIEGTPTPAATPNTTATAAETAAQVATEKQTVEPAAPATSGGGTLPDAPAKKGLPGFEGVFAIAGLLAIAYLVLRKQR